MVEWSLRRLHCREISMRKGELDVLGWRKSPVSGLCRLACNWKTIFGVFLLYVDIE
jgi:hypothetical protein